MVDELSSPVGVRRFESGPPHQASLNINPRIRSEGYHEQMSTDHEENDEGRLAVHGLDQDGG